MSCNIETFAVAPPCLELSSQRKQKETLLLFLCAVAQQVIPEFSCNWTQRLESARTSGLLCLSAGQLRVLQAQIVCDGLEVECSALQCYSIQDLEALQASLMCNIINDLNP